jgi:hypothetical protein
MLVGLFASVLRAGGGSGGGRLLFCLCCSVLGNSGLSKPVEIHTIMKSRVTNLLAIELGFLGGFHQLIVCFFSDVTVPVSPEL